KIIEPHRRTEVWVAPDAEVLQFYWYALRWVLDNRAAVWSRVTRLLSDDPGRTDPMPTIVSFHGARRGLGTTALAYGTGAELARSGGRTVAVIDLQGQKNFDAHWSACGFAITTKGVRVQEGARKRRAQGRRTELACHVLEASGNAGWPSGLKIVWPDAADADAVEDLVDALEAEDDLSHVVVAGSDREAGDLASQVMDRLHGRCSAVFYV